MNTWLRKESNKKNEKREKKYENNIGKYQIKKNDKKDNNVENEETSEKHEEDGKNGKNDKNQKNQKNEKKKNNLMRRKNDARLKVHTISEEHKKEKKQISVTWAMKIIRRRMRKTEEIERGRESENW